MRIGKDNSSKKENKLNSSLVLTGQEKPLSQLILILSLFMMIFSAIAVNSNTYYVNLSRISGANTGKDSADAWYRVDSINNHVFAPGDSILFARGTIDSAMPNDTFMPPYEKANKPYKHINGFICPQGSGSIAAPITIDAYGTGSMPVISGKGLHRTAAILLYNQDYWTIQNIEVRNYPTMYKTNGYTTNFADPIYSMRNQYLGWRWGIFAYFDDGNVHHNITIRHTMVDSVLAGDHTGDFAWPYGYDGFWYVPWWAFDSAYADTLVATMTGNRANDSIPSEAKINAWRVGGIVVHADGHNVPGYAADGPTTVDDVLINSNNVHDIFGNAITIGNDSINFNSRLDSTVQIIGDTIERTAVNGIHLTGGTDNAIISNNIIDSAGWRSKDTAILASNNFTIVAGSRRSLVITGIEFEYQKNTVVQFNSISNTSKPHPVGDGEAIDFDQNMLANFPTGHVVIQYNYSCNNDAGFIWTFASAQEPILDTSLIVRYNISQNDGMIIYQLNKARYSLPVVIGSDRGAFRFIIMYFTMTLAFA